MGRTVGIKAVAEAAGVSITTVSHALNGKGRLPPKRPAAPRAGGGARLGYRPSAMARGLAGGRTGMLGPISAGARTSPLQVGDFDYFLQLMHGAASGGALQRGFSLTLLQADERPSCSTGCRSTARSSIDPIAGDPVVGGSAAAACRSSPPGASSGAPTIACWVDNDHVAGTRADARPPRARRARGASRCSPRRRCRRTPSTRAAPTVDWCEARGQEPVVAELTGNVSEGGAYAAALELLAADDAPDGIYATLDRLALGALLAAEASGVAGPERLRIAGCTDSEPSRKARPALTALSLDPERLGREALDLLLDLVEDGASATPHRLVPATVVPRASTAP